MMALAVRLWRKYVLWAALDALVVAASLFLAWSARSITAILDVGSLLLFGLLAIGVSCGVNYLVGLYDCIWRYASANEVLFITYAVVVSTLTLTVVDLLWPGRRAVPLSVVLVTGVFSFVGFAAVRYRRRLWTGLQYHWRNLYENKPRTRVLIVGAGEAGQLMAWRILNQEEGQAYKVVGFVDDDPAKLGMRVHGRPVLGSREAIASIVARQQVDLIIIAIYNLSRQSFREILSLCESTPARIKVLPNIFEFIHSNKGVPLTRDVSSEDLLGRKPVEVDHEACRQLLAGKTVLVTGAAGSIGSELCRQIASFGPQHLIMIDNNESGLHDLVVSMQMDPNMPPLHPIVGDVTNRPKMRAIFERYHPHTVFHAAAYKHVPLMEEHPDEAVRVNVHGTLTLSDLACRYGAERFVLISTDKAVSPTCVMGITKRIGEMIVSSLAQSHTLCTCVRFGNVLGSRGSVVPIFEREIEKGGPLTITHLEMTRYFMTITEAVSLVIQAATLTRGGDLFVLDMGKQIRIEELAQRLVRLRGLRPRVDIPIKYIGIRPGEKLHEELLGADEQVVVTSHPAILRVQALRSPDAAELRGRLSALISLARRMDKQEITAQMREIVELPPLPALTAAGAAAVPDPTLLTTEQLSETGDPRAVVPGLA